MGTVIVHGPMACGKSRNADTLASLFGCNAVVEDWIPGDRLIEGAVHLTFEMPSQKKARGVPVVDFATFGLTPSTGVDLELRRVRIIRSERI